MEYIVRGSKNQNDSKLNLLWSKLLETMQRFDLFQQILVSHVCDLTTPK